MRFDIHLNLSGLSDLFGLGARILGKLETMETKMSVEFDALTAQVHANRDLLASATTLINGIADRIAAAGTDPAALQALTDELRQSDETLAAAVAANTPVTPAP